MSARPPLNRAGRGFTAVGAPSIIILFVMLCLACFAALSLVSANAEMRLAMRMGENTARWYAADAEAQRRLARLDELLSSGILDEPDAAAALAAEKYVYDQTQGEETIAFYTMISHYTALETTVRLEGGGYTLIRNATIVTGDLEYTQLPFLWDGVTIYD